MRRRALPAVIAARLYAQRYVVLSACAAAVAAGLLQPAGIGPALAFCCLLGVAMALAQSPGLHPHLDRCEQGAPLFGRELARAKAAVPCIVVAAATLLYAVAQAARGASDVPLELLVALAAALAATLTALSATIRGGAARLLYVGLAAVTAGAAYALMTATRSALAEPALCAVIAFFALRQYGEALARYDPI